jgi:hypothetical protein
MSHNRRECEDVGCVLLETSHALLNKAIDFPIPKKGVEFLLYVQLSVSQVRFCGAIRNEVLSVICTKHYRPAVKVEQRVVTKTASRRAHTNVQHIATLASASGSVLWTDCLWSFVLYSLFLKRFASDSLMVLKTLLHLTRCFL